MKTATEEGGGLLSCKAWVTVPWAIFPVQTQTRRQTSLNSKERSIPYFWACSTQTLETGSLKGQSVGQGPAQASQATIWSETLGISTKVPFILGAPQPHTVGAGSPRGFVWRWQNFIAISKPFCRLINKKLQAVLGFLWHNAEIWGPTIRSQKCYLCGGSQ